ncbi:MAG TPA: TlpA disulfide reductase family protein, partial [Myxococcota bacterium]|nr:TlpA disulfide reductase family protein [Myxococcota bacterium]
AARAALRRVVDAWPRTYGAQAAAELLDKLALIGSVVPAIDGVRWLQGEADLDDARVTLLVFWEVWCPHCQHYVPGLQPVADQYAQQGLQVVTLTRLSRDATEDQVRAFASEHALTFPIGHEDGHMSEALGVSGVPAAAALRGHTVIWRGHPAELDDATLAGWLAAP